MQACRLAQKCIKSGYGTSPRPSGVGVAAFSISGIVQMSNEELAEYFAVKECSADLYLVCTSRAKAREIVI
jgi:hypothetical protein